MGPALSSLYIGIFYAFVVFGPAIGFFMSSKFLLWHTDFMVTGQRLQKLYLYMMMYKIIVNFRIIDLDETDPKWVGAWYIGFILAAIFGLLAVFPILTFPKLLPESLKWHRFLCGNLIDCSSHIELDYKRKQWGLKNELLSVVVYHPHRAGLLQF